eukprot:gb/GFBE01035045.1/.p1 GENE.gb/GFBE01035045.1/~~gb/GFBE01035045.1/.p1  ORF type:complete len:713 (+),score=101.93 gb/GFBE01035045.1/:1-2139(+)
MNSVTFEVRCDCTQPGEHIRIVGSTRELGTWDPGASGVILHTSPDRYPIWESECLNLPCAASAEYKYVIVGGSRQRWETCANRQLVVGSSRGKVRISDEFDRCESQTREDEGNCNVKPSHYVSFQVNAVDVGPGRHVRVVGSLDELGAWSPWKSEVRMTTSAQDPSIWQSQRLSLSQSQLNFEYKYVLCSNTEAESVATWEGRPNRQVSGAHFQKPHVFVKDAFDSLEKGSIAAKHVAVADPEQQQLTYSLDQTSAPSVSLEAGEEELCVKAERSPKKHLTITSTVRRRISITTKSKTLPSPTELPQGLLATGRALEIAGQGVNGFAREAMCHQLQALKMAPPPVAPSGPGGGSVATVSNDAFKRFRVLTKALKDEGTDDGVQSSDGDSTADQTEAEERSEAGLAELEPISSQSFDAAYDLGDQLGEGAFGIVYRCSSRATKDQLASKVVLKSRLKPHDHVMIFGDEAAGREGEISIHRSLPHHPNVVGMHAHFEDEHSVNMILDLCPGGDLFDEIMRAHERQQHQGSHPALSEAEACRVIWQIMCAVDFCHSHGVVHRDIKAENVLLTAVPLDSPGSVVRLCDFGLAARCFPEDGETLKEALGSPDYIAPEIVRRSPYGQKVDTWSAGVLLYVCFCCYSPFSAPTDAQVLRNILKGKFEFGAAWDNFASEMRELVILMLDVDAKTRPTAEAVLSHDCLKRHGEVPGKPMPA